MFERAGQYRGKRVLGASQAVAHPLGVAGLAHRRRLSSVPHCLPHKSKETNGPQKNIPEMVIEQLDLPLGQQCPHRVQVEEQPRMSKKHNRGCLRAFWKRKVPTNGFDTIFREEFKKKQGGVPDADPPGPRAHQPNILLPGPAEIEKKDTQKEETKFEFGVRWSGLVHN